MKQKEIRTDKLGPVHGPYSQGILYNNLIFTTQVGSTPEKDVISDSVYEQTIQIFKNAKILLSEARSSLDKILKITIYILDFADFDDMNKAYREIITFSPMPARATVAVKAMIPGVKVEMEITAYTE